MTASICPRCWSHTSAPGPCARCRGPSSPGSALLVRRELGLQGPAADPPAPPVIRAPEPAAEPLPELAEGEAPVPVDAADLPEPAPDAPPDPDRREFESSNVSSARFLRYAGDPSRGEIEVSFRSGATYRYAGCTADMWAELGAARSAGTWVSERLVRRADQHPHRLAELGDPVREPAAPSPPCPHAMLRRLNAGRCPVDGCPGNPGPAPEVLSAAGEGASDVAESAPGPEAIPDAAAQPGSIPGPSTTDLDVEYRDPTADEAAEMLRIVEADLMTARFATFVRGVAGGTGAFHALEPHVKLDWNWHHTAICDHLQVMWEEWWLSGLEGVHLVERTLDRWQEEAEDDERLGYVLGMRAHWDSIRAEGGDQYTQRCTDAALNLCPTSLKSRIAMVYLDAWIWLRDPTFESLCASGNNAVGNRDSGYARDLVLSRWYRDTFRPDWTLRQDVNRIDKWATTAGGSRMTRSTDGKVIGVHVSWIRLDDPNDLTTVWSESERRDVRTFWTACRNRFKDNQRPLRLIVQQNLTTQDLTTELIAEGMPCLKLPVTFRPEKRAEWYTLPYGWRDPRVEQGDNLHPSRLSSSFLAAEKKALGTTLYSAQYECDPRTLADGMFSRTDLRFFTLRAHDARERARMPPRPSGCQGSGKQPDGVDLGTRDQHPPVSLRWRRPPDPRRHYTDEELASLLDLDFLVLTVDPSNGSTDPKKASACGLLVVGGKGEDRYVFDDASEVGDFNWMLGQIKRLVLKWGLKKLLIEFKAAGPSLESRLRHELATGEFRCPGLVIETPGSKGALVKVTGDKEARAGAMLPVFEGGRVYLLDGAPWLEGWIEEVCTFPKAARDDRVDALSQCLARYVGASTLERWKKWGGARRAG